MTNGLRLFLAFYILVGQPAILGRMMNSCAFYELAGLNAGVFFIARIVSAIYKSSKKKTGTEVIASQLLGETAENKTGSDIAMVKVQETTVKEIEVTKVEVAEENLPESQENKIEEQKSEELINNVQEKAKKDIETKVEKSEEKTSERPMKETVTIPKIVQPLTGHANVKKKRRREINWGQWLVLLVTLGIAAVIAWTLWEFLGNRGISISLFLGWILYLIIGKLFDIGGFYNAKKLFTNWLYIILILAGIGYGAYTLQQEDKSFLPPDFSEKVSTYVKGRFEIKDKDNNTEIDTGDVIYVFEGTGEVILDTGMDLIDSLDNAGTIEDEIGTDNEGNTEVDTGTIENIEIEVDNQPEPEPEEQPVVSPTLDAKKQVTMGEAVKSILADATLSTKINTTFKYVSKTSELYPYFKTAQEKWMIGTDTDPSKIVSCETFITMKGIREGWNVGNYVKSEIRTAYRKKAEELGKLNGCTKGAYVTQANL